MARSLFGIGVYIGFLETQQQNAVLYGPTPMPASAMLPDMAEKVRIAIVGPGNLGTALAEALTRTGYVIESIVGGRSSSSIRRGKALARKVGACVRPDLAETTADVIWFAVPDSEIVRAATKYAKSYRGAQGLVVLHASGALTSDALNRFREKGASVASAHPLMTFVRGARPSFAGVPFAVEGDRIAVRAARRIVENLGGSCYPIRKKDKPAYHAWAAFTSPLLTSLLAASESAAGLAGISRSSARQRMIPIMLQTFANYASLGAPGAFSGPIARGDVETVRKHLQVLGRAAPLKRAYVALANVALESLPSRNTQQLKKLLSAES